MNLYPLYRRAAFCFDAESIHEQTIHFASRHPFLASALFHPPPPDPRLTLRAGGLDWPFPVGLAAGMDKNACAVDFFSRLPFGAVEVGSVTPLPQPGNPRPRLFRLPREHSLRNHLGLNSRGASSVRDNILSTPPTEKILGINIGKNKATPEERSAEDYRLLYQTFEPICDYLVINVSSPNTPGLRSLQKKDKLRAILAALSDLRTDRPLFVKMAPGLPDEDINGIVELTKAFDLQGIIATNTLPLPERGKGGCSGRLLQSAAADTQKKVLEQLRETPHITVIGCGGIEAVSDLIRFWKQGGRVAQLYTALIYHGPPLLNRMQRDLLNLLDQSGASTLQEWIDNLSAP